MYQLNKKINTFTGHTWGIWFANVTRDGGILQRCSKFIGWWICHGMERVGWGEIEQNFRVFYVDQEEF